ncbi:MAG: thioredoxin family protein [Patescibacteria group bacterium]
MSHLLEFYGKECPPCIAMHPLVEKLEKEEGIKIETLEVWYNKENERRLLEIDKDLCGGVPFFYNTKTKKYLCGQVDYEELKNWAR